MNVTDDDVKQHSDLQCCAHTSARRFFVRVRLVDVINCAKFNRNRLRGLDSMSGQSLTIPIGLRYRR